MLRREFQVCFSRMISASKAGMESTFISRFIQTANLGRWSIILENTLTRVEKYLIFYSRR